MSQHVVGQPASSQIDYATDALGSVVATTDQTGAVVNTYRYKPYGSPLAKTGTAPDPAFTWVGSYGYRQTGKTYSDTYVRARHYASSFGGWTTKTPYNFMLLGEGAYTYSFASPIEYFDPSGHYPLTLLLNAFINKNISAQWNMPPPWFPEWPTVRSTYVTNSNNRIQYQFPDSDENKVRVRATIDTCQIGVSKAEIEVPRDGLTYQATWNHKLGSQFKILNNSILRSVAVIIGNDSHVADSCNYLYMSVQATHPFVPISPPVVLNAYVKLCRSNDTINISGNLQHTAFPDFDGLYKGCDGKWTPWFYFPTDASHPAIGLTHGSLDLLPSISIPRGSCL